ncbi:MAG TPA: HupE/UreJ family protein [Methylococcus sp.]|nr:HupE/UreJ family protein [Methylococcus sp.]
MKVLLWLVLALWAAGAGAHKPSDSYLSLEVKQDRIEGRWDIALRDLDYALGLDVDDDGAITWGELRSRQDEVSTYALAHLGLSAGTRVCLIAAGELLVDEHTDGRYAVLPFSARCNLSVETLALDYRLFFDLDPQHRGLLRLTEAKATRTAVLGPADGRRSFDLGGARDSWRELQEFLREGIRHIGIGYDHLLFLLSLLLPAVLVREARGRWSAGTFPMAFWDVAKVVTAFTLAHSVTLSLAALSYFDLPSRWVESAIAASILVVALNNLAPVPHGRRAAFAFGFGLVHGLGFARVLSDLGLPAASRLWGLVGFNLGVELGQMAMVTAFLPLAYGLSRHPLYQTVVLKAGSAGIAVLAGVWLLERAFDLPVGGVP